MGDTSIELWMNQYQYDALKRILTEAGTSVETVMQARLMEFYMQTVPENERADINCRIEGERLAEVLRAEERRRFSVFRIVEDRQARCLECEHPFDFLNAALQTRRYLRHELGAKAASFADYLLQSGHAISEQEYAERTGQYIDGSPNVTGVFDIDFDKGDFLTAQRNGGWAGFILKDVMTAIYHAYRKEDRSFKEKWSIFLERLDGGQMINAPHSADEKEKNSRRLTADDIHFSDEISEMNGRLNFYIETNFNVDQVFGTHVETTENDDWLNVYADFDKESRQVCDTLELVLNCGDGGCEELTYQLDDAEKGILLEKMNAYCQKCEELSLDAFCDGLQAEEGLSLGQGGQQL